MLADCTGGVGTLSAGLAYTAAVPDRGDCSRRGFRTGLGHRDIAGPVVAGIGVVPIPTAEVWLDYAAAGNKLDQ